MSKRPWHGRTDRHRRRFLRSAAAGAASLALGPALSAGAASSGMRQRPIPASGERIPIIGLGSARTLDVVSMDAQALVPLRGVLRNFHAGGGRLVDSSPMYGTAEQVIGRLSDELGIADELFMATKVWTRGETEGIEQMERSAERMGVARLDLLQVHNLLDLDTHLATLERWRDEGRVRYIGVTHYRSARHDELVRIVESEPIDFAQFNYNIASRNADERLLPACADRGVATLINEPFERGSLFSRVGNRPLPGWAAEFCDNWAQFFLKFILGHPAVTCAIPATSDPEHARENVRAGHGRLPDASERERMVRTITRL